MANKAKVSGGGNGDLGDDRRVGANNRRTGADDAGAGTGGIPAGAEINWDDVREKRVGTNDRRDGTDDGKVGIKLTKNQLLILENMAQNPRLTAALLAPVVGISSRKIEANVQKLKAMGLLERVGERKNGHWLVKLPPNM